jgi:hypothetical protein
MNNHELIVEEVKRLIRELRQTWLASNVPYELYHYTDARGLLGILTNKSFWATDINFLNDAMELKYASDLIDKILDIKIDESFEKDSEKTFWDYSKSILKILPRTMNAYVTCFCENGNLLSQWRAYGASGAGYSIGVITDSLKGIQRDGPGVPIAEIRLRKIIYNKETQGSLVTETIKKFGTLFLLVLGESDKEREGSIIQEFANYLAAELTEYLYCFKSPVFEEEQEWREIITVSNYHGDESALKFKTSGGNIVPYTEFPFAAPPEQQIVFRGYPISSITFGPSLHSELTMRSLHTLLESTLGYGNGVRVSSSDIPLRSTRASAA